MEISVSKSSRLKFINAITFERYQYIINACIKGQENLNAIQDIVVAIIPVKPTVTPTAP